MIVKWIQCHVNGDNKQKFSTAQAHWSVLKGVNGFLGQVGGWGLTNSTKAYIVSFWEDETSYQTFMNKHHDSIFHNSNQIGTYDRLEVTILECISPFGFMSLDKMTAEGTVLQVIEMRSLQKVQERTLPQWVGSVHCQNEHDYVLFQFLRSESPDQVKDAKIFQLLGDYQVPERKRIIVKLEERWKVH